jgi:VanZ family protein
LPASAPRAASCRKKQWKLICAIWLIPSLARQLRELLDLFWTYRPQQVAEALQEALTACAFGADYVAHLLAPNAIHA